MAFEVVVDADGHVCEPPDLWTRKLPAHLCERGLRLRWNADTPTRRGHASPPGSRGWVPRSTPQAARPVDRTAASTCCGPPAASLPGVVRPPASPWLAADARRDEPRMPAPPHTPAARPVHRAVGRATPDVRYLVLTLK